MADDVDEWSRIKDAFSWTVIIGIIGIIRIIEIIRIIGIIRIIEIIRIIGIINYAPIKLIPLWFAISAKSTIIPLSSEDTKKNLEKKKKKTIYIHNKKK